MCTTTLRSLESWKEELSVISCNCRLQYFVKIDLGRSRLILLIKTHKRRSNKNLEKNILAKEREIEREIGSFELKNISQKIANSEISVKKVKRTN